VSSERQNIPAPLLMLPQTRMGGVDACGCGASVDVVERRVQATQLDEEYNWWLATARCVGCGVVTERLHARVPMGKEGDA
jgi:hypothetical protein